mgnify:CR=1 FL=1
MKEIDDTSKDVLTDGIADAVRDMAKKREAMAGWEKEYSRKRKHGRILVASLASAACIALAVTLLWRNPSESINKEPVLRGGLSYDAAIERIDSLINAGDTAAARELLMQTRYEIAVDTAEMFHPVVPTSSDEEIEYSRIIIKDVLSRLDELEGKILRTNE